MITEGRVSLSLSLSPSPLGPFLFPLEYLNKVFSKLRGQAARDYFVNVCGRRRGVVAHTASKKRVPSICTFFMGKHSGKSVVVVGGCGLGGAVWGLFSRCLDHYMDISSPPKAIQILELVN